jgi:hypothetical protein
MRPAKYWGTENWADVLPAVLGFKRPPVDLYAIARHRHILKLCFRFMIPRGLMLPVEGGFEIYLRDQEKKDANVSDREPVDALTVRQRFSLAHEIAHTRFYRLEDGVSRPKATVSADPTLESLCDQMAGCILVPTYLLKQHVREYGKEIDATFVRTVARDFRISMEVALERLRVVEAGNAAARCILLVRKLRNDVEIQSIYFGSGLLPLLTRPERNTSLTDWLPNLPKRFLSRKEDSGSFTTAKGRLMEFKSSHMGEADDRILLEMKAS